MKRLILVMVILLLPAIAPLMQKGYLTMHDDLQAMRQREMNNCFHDKQFPCRWVSDMGYGYGYPLFNYYPPLPYYLGEVVHKLGFQFTDTVKVLGIIGFALSMTTMYLLAAQFWGRKGGVLAALFYVYAPYHSTDFYVRGAVNEFWALVWLPLIFWSIYRLIKDGTRWIPLVSFSIAALLLTHNLTMLIIVLPLVLWTIIWLIKFRNFWSIWHFAISAIWTLGLAAFYTLPVILEAKFVSLWTLTSGYFNFLAHFLDWRQMLLYINWGYGSSELGPHDTMSLAVGYLHWIVPFLLAMATLLVKPLRRHWFLVFSLLATFVFSLLMMHWKATPIWIAIKPLEFLQFPWRFLTLSIFTASFLAGAVVLVVHNKVHKSALLAGLTTLLLILNANYFRPREWLPEVNDINKFIGKNWQLQITGSIFDYLPIWAPLPPANGKSENLKFISGSGVYETGGFRTNYQLYRVEASQSATLQIQTFYFPGWRVWLDHSEVAIDPTLDPELGRIQVNVPAGHHELVARFTDTPVRFVANSLSLIAWAVFFLYLIPWWPKRAELK